jgi:6-pyruvoyltetrahydropterin/6-carboxytetrahydropterin synthase
MLEGNKLDNAGMLYDFGLMKGTVKEFIDSMDHCYILCSEDSDEFKDFIKKTCDRWIEVPFNPSAECLSMFIHYWINHIIQHTKTNNGEGWIYCSGVRYHETTTGWAESSMDDIDNIWNWKYNWTQFEEYKFSQGVLADWSTDLLRIMFNSETIENPVIEQQINLN